MENAKLDLSVVIPAYNEEAHLEFTLKDIAAYLSKKSYNYEIIVVDDGSKDKTLEIAASLRNLFPSMQIIKSPLNKGKGHAVKKGMLSAKGDFVLFMDADNSTRIDQLPKLIKALEEGSDIALASRRIPGAEVDCSQPYYRIILGNTYIMLSRIILGATVNDYNCGFKLYARDVVAPLFSRLTRDDWSFDSELIYLISKMKFKFKEVPVKWVDQSKTSKVRPLKDGINSFLSLITIRLNAIKKVYE